VAPPDALARRLGYAGLIPFVGGVMLLWLLAGRQPDMMLAFVVQALSLYACTIVAFLGGLPWGVSMLMSDDTPALTALRHRALWAGVAYSLAAWVAALMPPHAGLVLLGVLLALCYASDRKLYPALGAAGWLTMRFRLSVVASLCCFLAAAQL
jgi:hypothetical protein